MPTYNSNINLVPTQYMPIDYRHDEQFALAEAQQATQNIAKVKSRYEDLLGWSLTTDKSKDTLSTYMKGAEENLQKIAGMNMMVYDNAKQALDIFKPLTDSKGEYSYVMGDHAYTTKAQGVLSQIEESKTKDKGEAYNPDLERIVNSQLQLFSLENDPTKWKTYYYNAKDYSPGSDISKKLMELEKSFTDNVIGEGVEREQVLGNGYKYLLKDKSIYANEYADYLDTHLNAKEKEQLQLGSEADYFETLVGYASIKDPIKKADAFTKMQTTFKSEFDNQTKAMVGDLEKAKAAVEGYKQLTPASDAETLSVLSTKIANIDKNLEKVKNRKLTDKDISSIFDPSNWVAGKTMYMNNFGEDAVQKIAQSTAHSIISEKFEADTAYIQLAQLEETKRHNRIDENINLLKTGLKLDAQGNVIPDPGVEEYEKYMPGSKITSDAELGKTLYEQDVKEATSSDGAYKIIGIVSGDENFDQRWNQINKNGEMSKLTWQEAIDNKYITNDKINSIINLINTKEPGKININRDKADYVMATVRNWLSQDKNLDYLTTQYKNNPDLRNALIDAKTKLGIANSKAAGVNTSFKKALTVAAKEIVAPNGVSFASEMGRYKISNPAELETALKDFAERNGAWKNPIKGVSKGMGESNPLNPAETIMNVGKEVGRDVASYALGIIPHAVSSLWGGNAANTWVKDTIDVNSAMDEFYKTYATTGNRSNEPIGKQFHRTRPFTTDKKTKTAFDATVAGFAAGATDRPELNEFVRNFTEYVSDVYEGKQGYGVAFTSNMDKTDKETFLAAYNQMAEKAGFEDAGSFEEARDILNGYFATNRIPTRAIASTANKYNIDPNFRYTNNNNALTGAYVGSDKLSSVYGFPNGQEPINVSISNRAAGVSFDLAEADMSGIHFVQPIIKDNKISRDNKGNVQLEHVYGSQIFSNFVGDLMKQGYSPEEARASANQTILSNATGLVTSNSNKALALLELIKYLNTDGRKFSNLKDIPNETLKPYLTYIQNSNQ
jgi:hypothetical protein